MIVHYRPLSTWPDPDGLTPADSREPSRFEASWESTLALLDREVGMLAGDDADVVIEVAVGPSDFLAAGAGVKQRARPAHPGIVVSFDSTWHGPLRYWTDTFRSSDYADVTRFLPGWQANVRAVAKSLEALRLVERYGTAKRGQQYTGWAELGAGTPLGPPQPMTREEAARILATGAGLDWRPSLLAAFVDDADLLASTFRLAAKQHHPDNGGDAAVFRKITEARDLLVSNTKGST